MNLLFSGLLFLAGSPAYAPDTLVKCPREPEILYYCEELPEFPGGQDSLFRFIKKNLRYPAAFSEMNLHKVKVYMKFVVCKDGSTGNFTMLRNSCGNTPECKPFETEALRVLRLMPHWKPGKQNGRAVDVYFTIPVIYSPE